MTPKAPVAASPPRRSPWVRVAALVFVALVLLAFVIGCAPYDGDRAAFCDRLAQAPSFGEVSAQVEDGTDAQAEAAVRRAAGQFRAMEREAPRTIRRTVAALGDSADRIAHDLAPGDKATQVIRVPRDDGDFVEVEIPADTSRIGAFYRELQEHRGTLTAVYQMAEYARDECGITDQDVDLGMFGFGAPTTLDEVPAPGGLDGPDGGEPHVAVPEPGATTGP